MIFDSANHSFVYMMLVLMKLPAATLSRFCSGLSLISRLAGTVLKKPSRFVLPEIYKNLNECSNKTCSGVKVEELGQIVNS